MKGLQWAGIVEHFLMSHTQLVGEESWYKKLAVERLYISYKSPVCEER